MADSLSVVQVFGNLLPNAAKLPPQTSSILLNAVWEGVGASVGQMGVNSHLTFKIATSYFEEYWMLD